MKERMLLIILAISYLGCYAQNKFDAIKPGVFKQQGSSKKIELKSDNTYVLYNSEGNGHFEAEQCTYSSKGKWKQLSSDVLEITSENYYLQQAGFKYELKKG